MGFLDAHDPLPLPLLLAEIEKNEEVSLASYNHKVPFGGGAVFSVLDLFDRLSGNDWGFLDIFDKSIVVRAVENIEFTINPYAIAFQVSPEKDLLCLLSTDQESGILLSNSANYFQSLDRKKGFSFEECKSAFEFSRPRRPRGMGFSYSNYIDEWLNFIENA